MVAAKSKNIQRMMMIRNNNISINNTTSFDQTNLQTGAGEIFTIENAVFLLILVISVTGNSFTIGTVLLSPRQRDRKQKRGKFIDSLTAHLAVMDLLIVLSSIPEILVSKIYATFVFGSVGCKILYPLSTYAVIASTLTLLIISYERYQVSKAQTIMCRSKYKNVVLLSVNFAAIILVLPYSWILTYHDASIVTAPGNGSNSIFIKASCFERWDMLYRRAYTLVLFMVQYACPVVLMIYWYYHGWQNIKSSADNLLLRMSAEHSPLLLKHELSMGGNSVKRLNKTPSSSGVCTNSAIVNNSPNLRILFKRYFLCRELTKKFTIIVLVFLIFALPNQLLWLYVDFIQDGIITFDDRITNLSYIFTFVNCVINPLVYGNRKSKKNSTIFKEWRQFIKPNSEKEHREKMIF